MNNTAPLDNPYLDKEVKGGHENPQVFISYSRKDVDLAERLVKALAARSLNTWIDWKSIPKGEDWEHEIYQGIEEADAFLFLVSSDSVASEMCNKEITYAVKNGKRILPIFITNCDIGKVHEGFHTQAARIEILKRNYLFCRPGLDDFNKAIDEICLTIRTDYEWLRYHTKLQIKALDWDRVNNKSRLLRADELRDAEQRFTQISEYTTPQPTLLQREYILASRRDEERVRRRIVLGLSVGLFILAILTVFSILSRQEAVEQRDIAYENRIDGLSHQLPAQAKEVVAENYRLAALLAVQGFKFKDTPDARLGLDEILKFEPRIIRNITDNDFLTVATGVAISPDGSLIAGTDSSKQIYLWDKDGSLIDIYQVPTFVPRQIAISSNKRYLAASNMGSYEKSAEMPDVLLWNLKTGEKYWFTLSKTGISTLAFSPNNDQLAAGGDGTIFLLDVDSKELIRTFPHAHTDLINDIKFSLDSQFLVSAGSELICWNINTGTGQILLGSKGVAQGIDFSSDGSELFVTLLPVQYDLANIQLSFIVEAWDFTSLQLKKSKTIEAPGHAPHPFWISGINKLAIAAGGRLVIYDPVTLEEISNQLKTGNANLVVGDWIQKTKDGELVALGQGGIIAIYNLNNQFRMVDTLTPYPNDDNQNVAINLIWKPDMSVYATSKILRDSEIRIWNARTHELMKTIGPEDGTKVMVYHPSREILVTSQDSQFTLWNTTDYSKIRGPIQHPGFIISLSFSSDGKWLAVSSMASSQVQVTLYDFATLTTRQTFAIGPNTTANSIYNPVRFGAPNKILLNNSKGSLSFVDNLDQGNTILEPLNLPALVPDLGLWDLSDDGKILSLYNISTENTSRTLEFWDIEKHILLSKAYVEYMPTSPWPVDLDSLGAIFASIDCKIVSLTDNRRNRCGESALSLIDVFSGLKRGEISVADSILFKPTFTKDSSILAFSNNNGQIFLWDMSIEKRLQSACNIAGRNLSYDEWTRYVGSDIPYQKTCEKFPVGYGVDVKLKEKPSQRLASQNWTVEAYNMPDELELGAMYIEPDWRPGLEKKFNDLHFYTPAWSLINNSTDGSSIEGLVELVAVSPTGAELNRYRFSFDAETGTNLLKLPRSTRVRSEELTIFRLYFHQIIRHSGHRKDNPALHIDISPNKPQRVNGRIQMDLSLTNQSNLENRSIQLTGFISDTNGTVLMFFDSSEYSTKAIGSQTTKTITLLSDINHCASSACFSQDRKYKLYLWATLLHKSGHVENRQYFILDLPDEFTRDSSYLFETDISSLPTESKLFDHTKLVSQNADIEYRSGGLILRAINVPDNVTLSEPYIIQCRENNVTANKVDDYLLIWPFRANSGKQWFGNVHAALSFSDLVGKVEFEEDFELDIPADAGGVIIPSTNKDGVVIQSGELNAHIFTLVFDQWDVYTADNLPTQKYLQANLLAHSVYSLNEYPQHRFLLEVKNTGSREINEIEIWGVVKDTKGAPIDIVTKWQGRMLLSGTEIDDFGTIPDNSFYDYALVSLSQSGRCTMPSNYADEYSLELWINFRDYRGQFHSDKYIFDLTSLSADKINGQEILLVQSK